MAKGEITRFKQFLLLSLCLQKAVCCRGIRKRLCGGKGSRRILTHLQQMSFEIILTNIEQFLLLPLDFKTYPTIILFIYRYFYYYFSIDVFKVVHVCCSCVLGGEIFVVAMLQSWWRVACKSLFYNPRHSSFLGL